jgi:hypothetical protein
MTTLHQVVPHSTLLTLPSLASCTHNMPTPALLLQGTLDQLLARGPSREGALAAGKAALSALHGGMRPGGSLLLFSHSPPTSRMDLLSSCSWDNVQVGSGQGVRATGSGYTIAVHRAPHVLPLWQWSVPAALCHRFHNNMGSATVCRQRGSTRPEHGSTAA